MKKDILLVVLVTVTLAASAQNECFNTVYKELGNLAKRNPTYFQDAVPLCDRYLLKGWYVALHNEMPTSAPDLGYCGTTYPYWLDDTLPKTQGTSKAVKVCEVGFFSECSRSHYIQVKNCGSFFVYELTPLDICSSAYCFQPNKACVTDVPSNIVVGYHGVTWTSSKKTANIVYDPDVNLVCQFDRLPDQSLYYDVTWYVDDTEVLTNQTVSSNSSDLALLTGSQMLAKGKKANSMIHCVVGAKISATDIPCKTSASSLFFAGIKVLNTTLRIPRGGHQDAKLQFTIPFVNEHLVVKNILEIQIPLFISMGFHGGSVSCDDLNKKNCDTKVFAFKKQETNKYATDEWKSIYNVRVYNKDDGDFTIIDKHITLRFKTGVTYGNGSKIFENLTLPDIQVYIEDTDSAWKGAYCESHTDPHMKTFDRKRYECQLDGTFILYRNTHFEQEVQEKHHLCHKRYSYPRCSCAVAVRSGKDVFMVDICNSKSIIHFPSCGDRVLKVIKTNDRYYKVIMPTGTLVEIKFVSWPTHNDWQLNIDIYPSPSDVGKTSGLCGILDGNYQNDFTRNDAGKTVDDPNLIHPNEFSQSWRVKADELDLFDDNHYANLKSISEVLDQVCMCKKIDKNDGSVTHRIECNYGTYKNCKFVVGKQYYCILNPEGQLRRKRDVRHLESIFSKYNNVNGPDLTKKRLRRETIVNEKTYEEAETICSNAFLASRSYQTCQEYVSDLSNTSLVNCISDVMMTGDSSFTQIHIEATLEQCSVFVVLNTTFQQTEPAVTNTIETFCQNNCSGHGICNAGNCTCETGYAGSDCSFDLLGPPTISHISDFGFCDKSSESCDEITMFGKYFIENMNTNCFMKRHTLREEGDSVSVVDYVVSLEERTLFEGFCPLEYDTTNHWVTIFSFNVSNDGSRFTEIFHVYTYQSLCQEYRNDTGNVTFVFKDGYCYINNSCVADGSTNLNNKCDICSTEKSRYEWSFNEGHCLISGVCYKSGDIEDTNPCKICDPSVDKTAWTPNRDFCSIDGICYSDGQTETDKDCQVCQPNVSRTNWTLKNDHCLIHELCFMNSQFNESNPCQICNTSQSKDSWTENHDFCFIDGTCFSDDQTQIGKDCLSCQPNSTRTNWTLKTDHCLIHELCFTNSQSNESNPCQLCNTSQSKDSWTENPDFCYIHGTCYNDSQTQVGKDCLVCQPNSMRTSWTLKNDHCLIQGLCFMNRQSNESNPCQLCNVSESEDSWTENPDFCFINGTCFSDGRTQEGKNCHVCQPNSSRTNWTLKNDHCLIQELCFMNGQTNEYNPCQLCNASQSEDSWTENPDLCFINGTCFSFGQTQVEKDCLVCQPNSTRTNWTLKNDHCLIHELCFTNSQSNESNPCQLCNTSHSRDSWTENPDFCFVNEKCFGDGQTQVGKDCLVCQPNSTKTNWTLKTDHCLIHGLCFMNSQSNESNPCQLCNASQSKDSWTENPDFCYINGTCFSDGQTKIGKDCLSCQPNSTRTNWTLENDYCLIHELCFMNTQSNESNPCQLCNASQSKDSWTENPDFCFIDGKCFSDGETQLGKDCLVCQPNSTRTSWTLKTDYCLIHEMCIINSQSNESNPCQLCNTSQSKDSWTENPDFCFIDGSCFSDGQTQVGKDCLVCLPNSTRTNWTLKTDHCLIQELCFTNSQSNESNPCQVCNTSQSKDSWTENPDFCFVNGKCFGDGQTEIGKDCLVCQPNSTRTNWTLKNDHCLIHELCFMDNQSNESNPCQVCNTSQSKDSWTENTDFCFIDGTCFSNGQTQVGKDCLVCQPNSTRNNWTLKTDYCRIQELCFMNSQSNESNPCQVCNTSQSKDSWTENTDFCFIDGSCFSDGHTQVGKDCLVCLPNSTRTNWTLENNYCLIHELCFMNIQSNESNPCQLCNTSQSKDSWTENPDCSSTVVNEFTTSTERLSKASTTKPTTTTTIAITPTTTTIEATTTTTEPTTSTLTQKATTTINREPSTLSTTKMKSPSASFSMLTTSGSTKTTTTLTTTSTSISTQPHCIKSPEEVSVMYLNVSWISSNETNGTIIRTVHEPYINFRCNFHSQHGMSVFYKIKWYVNNATLIKTVTVSEADIDQATLSSKGLPPLDQTAGLQIHCAVSVSNDPVFENCGSTSSSFFFAGIKVIGNNYNLLRKGKTAVTLYLTIPYVTKTVAVNGQTQPLPGLAIYSLLSPSTSRCRGSLGVDKCFVKFEAFSFNERHKYDSNDWRENKTLVLYHLDTDGYEIDQFMRVQLKTRSDVDMFWNNFNQNISITITDYNEHWKGKSCGSKTDPHMYTFDGVSYENHINGEFILYRNKLYNQEIQTRHKKCHPDYSFPHCTCAVSVQSGQDIHLMDLCGDIKIVGFLNRSDSVIQVFKQSDKLYKISLPTGTNVKLSIVEWPVQGSWQIDIDIYPSLLDVSNTEGLCGSLDGRQDNDFTRRTEIKDSVNLLYPNDFSNSWKVLSGENLLIKQLSKRQSISANLDKICLCSPSGDQCSYNTFMHCSKTVEKKFRKKRDIIQEWILPRSLERENSMTRKRREVQFNISTTRENAETVCTSAFKSSETYKTCHDYVSDLSNSSLSNCINDVIMTGDHNITAIHVEAALQQCVTFVGLNTTLQNAHPTVTSILQNLCPSNCSGHGVCNTGNCFCEAGFGGSDCSFDISSPPVIWESTPNGTCDKSLHQCFRIYFKGRYFLENVEKKCFVTKQSIHYDGSMLALTQLELPLEEENLFRGSCSLQSDVVTSWVTKYMFNVSYDRKQFTQTFSFYIYQSECQQHSVENGYDHFTLKNGYCFINNACVQSTVVNPEHMCEVCDPSKNNYHWSDNKDCEPLSTSKPPESSDSTSVFIVLAVVLSFLVLVTILISIRVWRYKRSRRYANFTENEHQVYKRNVVSKYWMRFFDDGKFSYTPEGIQFSNITYSSQNAEGLD